MQVPKEQKRSSTEPSCTATQTAKGSAGEGTAPVGATEGMAMGAEERRLWRQDLDQRATGISRSCLQL